MNRIYRVIRSRIFQRDVVVSEITKTTSKSISEARVASRNNPLVKMVLSGLLTAGLASLPAGYLYASDITDLKGNSLITPTDKVHNLYAQKINASGGTGSVGVSKYGKFNVSAGDIANMHFKERNGTVYADSLVNLVNSKINIAGTVNALKNNRIGGHLYFLSPQGMAVSRSGVINAGQFTAIVPTTKLFESLRDGNADNFNLYFHDYVMEKGIEKDTNLSEWYSTDSNHGIQIDGAINTRSGIKLRSSKIDIAQGAKLLSNQKIDFSSLVNTTQAGLPSTVGMTAVADDKTGDIVLKAEVENSVTDGLLSPSKLLSNKITENHAVINVDGTLASDGDVVIGAAANTTFKEGSFYNVLDGTDLVGKLLGAAGLNMMADYVDKTNTARITLGENGSITSGGETDISAKNKLTVSLNAVTPGKKTGEALSEALPVVSVGVVNQMNKASVDVYGDIASGGNLGLNASAESTVVLKVKSATEVGDDNNANLIYASLGIIANDTDAIVHIHKNKTGNKTISSGGKVDISANVSDDLTMFVESSTPEETFLSTAVGVIDSDTDASVIIDRSIDAKGNDTRKEKEKADNPWVSISTENLINNGMFITNEEGGIAYDAEFKIEALKGDGVVDAWLNPLISGVQGKLSNWRYGNAGQNAQQQAGVPGANNGGDVVSSFLTGFGSYIKPGASVTVATEDNTSRIDISEGVKIDAGPKNAIGLESKTEIESMTLTSEGVGNNQEDEQQTQVMVAAGVLVDNIENTASVHLGKNAQLVGGDVEISADADMYYNPIKSAAESVGESWQKVWNKLKQTGKDLKELAEIGTKIENLKNIDDPTKLPNELVSIKTMSSNRMDVFLDSIKSANATYTALKKAWLETLWLLDPATYTNYYARSEIRNTKQGDQSSVLDVAGAVSVDLLHNEAVVVMDEGAKVLADGDASVHAGTKTQTVSITGAGGKYLQMGTSGKSGVGASVLVQNITGDGLVLLGKDTEISGENVKVESDNLMKQWGIVYGSGEAGKIGVTGMVNIMNGDSNSIVSIDDEAKLSGTEKIDIQAKNNSTIFGIAGGATLGQDSTYAAVGFGLTDINFDVNTIAVIADNAKDISMADWLTEKEQQKVKEDATQYRKDMQKTVTAAVELDIQNQTIAADQKEAEITQRLQALYEAKVKELTLETINKKTSDDATFAVIKKRAAAVNLARSAAEKVAIHTYGDPKNEAQVRHLDMRSALGEATKAGNKGSIETQALKVSAENAGTVNSVAIEGTYSASDHGWYEKYNKFMNQSKASSFMDWLPKAVEAPVTLLNKYLGGKIAGKLNANQAANNAGQQANPNAPAANVNLAGQGNQANPTATFRLAATGSLAFNLGDGETTALIDNTAIKGIEDKALKRFEVKASDSLFSGTWAGGAAWNSHYGPGAGSSNEFSAGAAVAFHSTDRNVASLINQATVEEVEKVTNEASKSGADVAAALGLAVSKGESGELLGSGAASLSYNNVHSDVHALMVNNTVTGRQGASLTNQAFNQDIQMAGGVDLGWASGGDDSMVFGGAASVNRIHDSLLSAIEGGTYTQMGDMTVEAVKASLQVDAAVAGAISTTEASLGITPTVAIGEVDNLSQAFIRKATITSQGTVHVEANETANENSYKQYLKDRGIDPEGTSYSGQKGKELLQKAKGASKTMNFAVGVGYSGSGSGSAAASVNALTEKMKSDISDTKLKAQKVQVQSDSKATVFSLAMGVSTGGDWLNGAGSFSWNSLQTEDTVLLQNNTIQANEVLASADNQSSIVNIAGEANVGKGVALGLTFAYNGMDNTTGALIKGGQYQAFNPGQALSVAVDSTNLTDIAAVAVGGNISTQSGAWNGTLAINRGNNNTESAIEADTRKDEATGQETSAGTRLDDVQSIHVQALDQSTRRAGAGDLVWTAQGVAAAGAAVGYSDIGGLHADPSQAHETLRAEIKQANITTQTGDIGDRTIQVTATDKSTLSTAGIGLVVNSGAGNKLNGQGAAAVGVIAKQTTATIHNTRIDEDDAGRQTGSGAATLRVNSSAYNDIGSGGVAISGGMAPDSIGNLGVGLAINKISNQTTATVGQSHIHAADVMVQTDTWSKDLGVAAGVSGTTGMVSVAGSFNYNYINNSAKAAVDASTIVSQGNIGVISKSDEIITNYAGALEGAKEAAFGASVALNEIKGDTVAQVSDSHLNALAQKGKVTVESQVADNAILAHQVSRKTFVPDTLKAARTQTAKTGVVVDSSATHAIATDLVSAGAAKSGAIEITYSDNSVTGTTAAAVTGTDINREAVTTRGFDTAYPAVSEAQDVSVMASDYANIGVFEAGIGGAANVSVGATTNYNLYNRITETKLEGNWNNKSKINANDLDVKAVSKQGLSNLGIAGAVSGEGFSSSANLMDDVLNNVTKTHVSNVDIGLTGRAAIRAENLSRAYIGTYGLDIAATGVGLGAGIGNITQTAQVSTTVSNSVISDHLADASTDDKTQIDISASNIVDTGSYFTAVSAAGYGGSGYGTFTINDFNATVGTSVESSTLKADTIDIQTKEDLYAENYGANIAGSAFFSLGVNSTSDTVRDHVYTQVTNSALTARKQLSINTETRRDLRQTVANVAGAIGAIGLNFQKIYVNKAITDQQVLDKIKQANNTQTDFTSYFVGLDAEAQERAKERAKLSINTSTVPTQTAGVHTVVKDTKLSADRQTGTVQVGTTERNRFNSRAGGGGVGLATTTLSGIEVHYLTDVQLTDSDVSGQNVLVSSVIGDNKKHLEGYQTAISAQATEESIVDKDAGMLALTGLGSVIGAGGALSSADVTLTGASGIGLTNTGISGDTVTLSAADASHQEAFVTAITAAGIAYGDIEAVVNNQAALAVNLAYDKPKTIQADRTLTVEALKSNVAKSHTTGGGFTIAGYRGNSAKNTDKSLVGLKLSGAALTVRTPQADFSATNTLQLDFDIDNHGLVAAGGIHSSGLAYAKSKALVDIAANNLFNVDRLSFASQVGEAGKTTVSGRVASASVSGIDFSPDTSTTQTETTSEVILGGERYKVDADGNPVTDLTVSAGNQLTQENKAWMLGIEALSFSPDGAVQGYAIAKDTVRTTAGGGQVKSINATAQGHDAVDNYVSGNGGAIVGLGVASKAVNDFNTNAKTLVGGAWQAETFSAKASQQDTLESETFSGHGGVIDVTWVQGENTMQGKSLVQVAEKAQVKAQTVDMQAMNHLSTNQSGKYKNRVKGVVGGPFVGNITTSDETVSKTAEIAIGRQAQLLTAGQQRYEAYTRTAMDNTTLGVVGGFLDGGTARAYTTHTYNNTVSVDEGALLQNTGHAADGGITLAAHENLSEHVDADANINGVIGIAPNSRAWNTTTRNDQITLKGTIDSTKDINLYAGAGLDGTPSTLKHETISETYNHSLVAIGNSTYPKVSLTGRHQVVVAGTGHANALRNINVIADGGKEEGYFESRTYNLWTGGNKVQTTQLSVIDSVSDYTRTTDNYLRVDTGGELIAGNKSHLDVAVTGVMVPEGTIAGQTDAGGYTIRMQSSDGQSQKDLENQVKTGTMDYANVLANQWLRLGDLLMDYEGRTNLTDEQLTAYAGYLQERKVLEEQMASLGLMHTQTDSEGQQVTIPVLEGYQVTYVEMPEEMSAIGGSLTVSSDNLYGGGTLKASNYASINIDNTSNAYLKLNDILLENTGDGIVYRGEALSDGKAGIERINRLNKNSTYQAGFSQFDTGETQKRGITVTNENKVGTDISVIRKDGQRDTYKSLSTVEVAGTLQGDRNQVLIENKSGSIIINSSTDEKPVGIIGKEIVINARDTISQGFTDGMVNIGYTPEKVLTPLENEKKKETETFKAPGENKHEVKTAGDGQVSDQLQGAAADGLIAGSNIYLAASAINVNGLIQSGYGNYSATITQEAVDNAITASLNQTGGVFVNGQQMYKVNEGGMTLQKDGSYGYTVQVYYDPLSGNLVTEDLDTKGGHVYLSGRILSTGQGRILAMDGGADMTIENGSTVGLGLGRIHNNQIDGSIEITDTQKNTRTVYTRSNTVTITDYKAWLNAKTADEKAAYVVSEAAKSTYEPLKDLRYNWTDGTETSTKTTYQTDTTKFLGLIQTDEIINAEDSKDTKKTTEPMANYDLPSGSYVSVGEAGDAAYILTADNQKLNESRSSVDSWTQWSFLNRHYYSKWTKTTGTVQTYANSLIADKPIQIGFLGHENGSIAVSGQGDVFIKNNIRNNSPQATLSVHTSSGNIDQQLGTTIFGNRIDMAANGSIENLQIESLDQPTAVNLNMVSQTGDISADVTGHAIIQNVAAGVDPARVAGTAGTGDVVLGVTGNILQSTADDAYGINGKRIDLASTMGAVGHSETQPLKVTVGQDPVADDPLSASLNVRALADIHLLQETGDMRVGHITSSDGDVSLTASQGTIADATPYAGTKNNADTEHLVERWIDIGLIQGEGAYTRQLAQDVADYQQETERAYADYRDRAAWFAANPHAPEDTDSATYQAYQDNLAAYEALAKRFAGYSDAAAYLAADSEYQALVKQQENPKYAWTKEQMLYAVRNSIVNKDTGSTDQEMKDANVSGRNITLTGWGIGTDKEQGTATIITADMLSQHNQGDDTGKTYVDYLKTLANADAADVTVVYEQDANGQTIKQRVPVYQQDERGQVVLDDNQQAVIDHYEDGDPVIAQFVLGGKKPLGIYATGTINAKSLGQDDKHTGDIYLASRSKTESEPAIAMQIGQVTVKDQLADVRLLGKEGVYNALSPTDAPTANVSARNLIVEGGRGSIGFMTDTAEINDFTVNLAGHLTARADGSIWIRNINDDALAIDSLRSLGWVSLYSPAGLVMSDDNSDLGYINAKQGLSLSVDPETGVIGTENQALRILNTGTVLEIAAASANIYGVSGGESDTMRLGSIQTKGSFTAISEGDLDVLGTYEKQVVQRDANGLVIRDENGRPVMETYLAKGGLTAGDDTHLGAAGNLTLDAPSTIGAVNAQGYATDGKTLTLSAAKGQVMQSDQAPVIAAQVKTYAGGDITLENEGNHFAAYTVGGMTPRGALSPNPVNGDVRVKTHGGPVLSVGSESAVYGDIVVTNLDADGALSVDGALTAKAANGVGGKIDLTAEGGIRTGSEGSVAAQTLTPSTIQGVDLYGAGNQIHEVVIHRIGQEEQLDLAFLGDVKVRTSTAPVMDIAIDAPVNGSVSFMNESTNGRLVLSSPIIARKTGQQAVDLSLVSAGDLVIPEDAFIHSDDAMHLTSQKGTVNLSGHIETGNWMAITAGKDLWIDTALDVPNNLRLDVKGQTAETANGSIAANTVSATVLGTVDLQHPDNAIRSLQVIAGTLPNGRQAREIAGDLLVTSQADVFEASVYSPVQGNIMLTNLQDNGQLKLNASSLTKDAVQSGGDTKLVAKGDIFTVPVTAQGDIALISENGDITVQATQTNRLQSKGGHITAQTGNGNITYNGDVLAKKNLDVRTARGNVDFAGSQVTADRITIETGNGNIDVASRLDANKGGIALKAADPDRKEGVGNIQFQTGSTLTSASTIQVTTVNGDITVAGTGQAHDASIQAVGDITMDAVNTGQLAINGKVQSTSGKVSLNTDNGNITVNGNIDASAGNVVAVISEKGNMVFDGSVTAGHDVVADIEGKGNVRFVGDIAASHLLGVKTNDGDIDFIGDKTAGATVDATTANGNITVWGTVTSTKTSVTPADIIDQLDGSGIFSQPGIRLQARAKDAINDYDAGNIIFYPNGRLISSTTVLLDALRYKYVLGAQPDTAIQAPYGIRFVRNGSFNSKTQAQEVTNMMGRALTGSMFPDWYDIAYFDRYVLVQADDGLDQQVVSGEVVIE